MPDLEALAAVFERFVQRSPHEPHAELRLNAELLARCDQHGGWIAWLA
jgi:hypothetical protein